jgi:hypothetical protein
MNSGHAVVDEAQVPQVPQVAARTAKAQIDAGRPRRREAV